MTSKNSFLLSMKENLKRRSWVFAASMIFFFLYFPVLLATIIQSALKQQELYPRPGFAIEDAYMEFMCVNSTMLVVVLIFAIVCAIQGFSYLYSRKKVDMYHSVPVSRHKRFAVIYLNGFLLYMIPYTVNLLIGYSVISVFGNLTQQVLAGSLIAYGINMIFFLAIYSIVIIAIMLTGNIIVTVLATGVLLLYEIVVRNLFQAFSSLFFATYLNPEDFTVIYKWLSPIANYAEIVRQGVHTKEAFLLAMGILVLAIVFGILAFVLYLVRPSEASGKAMAFSKTKMPVKLFIMIPFSLVCGIYIYQMTYKSIGMTVFAAAIGILLSHSLVEVIYEFDIRAIFHKKRQILYALAITGIIFCMFRFDLFGYDNYVPKEEEVEYVSLSFSDDSYQNFYTEDNRYENVTEYCFAHMRLKDIKNTLILVEDGEAGMPQEGVEGESYTVNSVKYTLKNGKEVYRRFTIAENDTAKREALNAIYVNPEYKKNSNQIFDNPFLADILAVSVSFSDGITGNRLQSGEIETLLKIYKEELLQLNYTERAEQLPCGRLLIEYEDRNWNQVRGGYGRLEWTYPIYPSFTKTIAYLQEIGVYLDYKEMADSINKIEISYDNPNREGEYRYSEKEADVSVLQNVKIFTDKEEIEEIYNSLYPASLQHYVVGGGEIFDYNLRITVYFNGDNRQLPSYETTFSILKEAIPDFVKESVQYVEE